MSNFSPEFPPDPCSDVAELRFGQHFIAGIYVKPGEAAKPQEVPTEIRKSTSKNWANQLMNIYCPWLKFSC
jgi:hypothetical protein